MKINRSKVLRALMRRLCGKSSGLNGIASEFLKKGGHLCCEVQVRLFNVYILGICCGTYLKAGKKSVLCHHIMVKKTKGTVLIIDE